MEINDQNQPKAVKRFYCKALHGESSYNICINSDMSVSCNCQDYSGRGRIGSLKSNTLGEVFGGEAATRLRRALYDGRIPIPECVGCPERVELRAEEGEGFLESYQIPTKGIMVENTALCNYKCLNCNRSELMSSRGAKTMSLEDMAKVSETVREYGIQLVNFFNLGEPFLSKRVFQELSILRSDNPTTAIYTSTHGMLLEGEEKMEAALLLDLIYFSIDGSDQETVPKYQIGADFDRSYRNMKRLVEVRNERGLTKPVVEWKYVLFPWNAGAEHVNRAIELALAAEVDVLSFWRGGGNGTYETIRPAQFEGLAALAGIGHRSWKGREIDFRAVDFTVLKRLRTMTARSVSEATGSSLDLSEVEKGLLACMEERRPLSSAEFVSQCYRCLLEREADSEGARSYTTELESGRLSRKGLVSIFLRSEEFAQLADRSRAPV